MTPKYLIANRALGAIVDRLQSFAAPAPSGSPRRVETGLFVFQGANARAAVAFDAFNAEALRGWTKSFSTPNGPTPLGEALRAGTQAVLNSSLSQKHVLVLTDGVNTSGPDPTTVLTQLKTQADRANASLFVHFIAFDVEAKVFDGVKKLGATVVGAADEKQLNTQLEFILEQKILLEAETPAKPRNK